MWPAFGISSDIDGILWPQPGTNSGIDGTSCLGISGFGGSGMGGILLLSLVSDLGQRVVFLVLLPYTMEEPCCHAAMELQENLSSLFFPIGLL